VVDWNICGCCHCSGILDLDINVSGVCSGYATQCGMLSMATAFYLHNKLLLCRVKCTVYYFQQVLGPDHALCMYSVKVQ